MSFVFFFYSASAQIKLNFKSKKPWSESEKIHQKLYEPNILSFMRVAG